MWQPARHALSLGGANCCDDCDEQSVHVTPHVLYVVDEGGCSTLTETLQEASRQKPLHASSGVPRTRIMHACRHESRWLYL